MPSDASGGAILDVQRTFSEPSLATPSAASLAPESSDLLLPPGTRLLHIGPPKTGTTAIQSAFHLARKAARRQGVHYAGFGRHSSTEVRAVLGLRSHWDERDKPPSIRHWNRLVREIRSSDARCVVLSSENLARAEAPAIERVIRDIAPDGTPVHVAVTLRPVARLLTSRWQQSVQNRLVKPFDSWLVEALRSSDGRPAVDFGGRPRDDVMIRRWVEIVGAGNVTVIVLDEGDPGLLYRTFEALVGLAPGTLAPDPDLSNRSLTVPEIEAIRAFNVQSRAERLPRTLYTRVIRRGAAALMERRRPDPSEPRIELPPWSIEPISAMAREIVAGTRDAGVRVIGDLDRLLEVRTTRTEAPQDAVIPADVAAALAMGVLVATGAARGASTAEVDDDPKPGTRSELARPYAEPPELLRISTPHLLLTVARRARASLFHRLAHPFRRRGPGGRPE